MRSTSCSDASSPSPRACARWRYEGIRDWIKWPTNRVASRRTHVTRSDRRSIASDAASAAYEANQDERLPAESADVRRAKSTRSRREYRVTYAAKVH